LYDNDQGIQDQFANFWGTVAKFFANNDYVLGYEIINEPWAGDIYRHPNQLEPRKLTKGESGGVNMTSFGTNGEQASLD